MSNISNYNRLNDWPLQFLRTGYYDRSRGWIGRSNDSGYWWSNTTSLDNRGYDLASYPNTINAMHSFWRGDGFALRCGGGVRFLLFRTPQKPK